MNRIFLLLMLAFAVVAAHAQRVFSVVTCPAEDASVAMNVSWATDADAPQSHVIFTESTDKLWRNARRATDVDMHLCTTFDSLWSLATSAHPSIAFARQVPSAGARV